jgi:hypothetical protein
MSSGTKIEELDLRELENRKIKPGPRDIGMNFDAFDYSSRDLWDLGKIFTLPNMLLDTRNFFFNA